MVSINMCEYQLFILNILKKCLKYPIWIWLVLGLLGSSCQTRSENKLTRVPAREQVEVPIPVFVDLELVGSPEEKMNDQESTPQHLPEKQVEPILPLTVKRELALKGSGAQTTANSSSLANSPSSSIPPVNGNGFSIMISSSRLEVGEPITFYVNTTSSLTWQLGDGTVNTGKRISHIFQKPGQYKVEAFNTERTQKNRIEILVLCSPDYLYGKLFIIQKAAYKDDERALLRGMEEFKRLFPSSGAHIELESASPGKGARRFNDLDSFLDYLLVKAEQNTQNGKPDLPIVSGVRYAENMPGSFLLSKISMYE